MIPNQLARHPETKYPVTKATLETFDKKSLSYWIPHHFMIGTLEQPQMLMITPRPTSRTWINDSINQPYVYR